jgi:putative alpha-1,2-mannosidase
VEINLQNGKVFSIVAKNNSAENLYVQSVKLNGVQPLTNHFLPMNDILKGGVLEFEMGAIPNKTLFN